ncbi:hypothetical protein NLJ89_g6290 [Agrocybe chaxingu]|uniref:Uncharacterized protein n=1 Tax=Agrocybe chaxingu TaxID=84603 RepID=A0A9W8MUS6_9AGAR|nr:hypothetical protein NLJ89_g6290 [Agrocybe chaxingu]
MPSAPKGPVSSTPQAPIPPVASAPEGPVSLIPQPPIPPAEPVIQTPDFDMEEIGGQEPSPAAPRPSPLKLPRINLRELGKRRKHQRGVTRLQSFTVRPLSIALPPPTNVPKLPRRGDEDRDEDENANNDEEDLGNEGDTEEDNEEPFVFTEKTLQKMINVAMKETFGQNPPSKDRKRGAGTAIKRKHKSEEVQAEKKADKHYERTTFLGLVNNIMSEIFDAQVLDDYMLHLPPSADEIFTFYNGGPGPKLEGLHIDMRGKISSKWNECVTDILLDEVLKRRTSEAYELLPKRSRAYFREIIREKLERARGAWKNGQPKMKENGDIESIIEVENRVVEARNKKEKLGRAYTRRTNRLKRRLEIVRKKIELLKEAGDFEEAARWEYLEELLMELGEEGMSSDESEGEDDDTAVETVLYVAEMPWRPNISQELSIIEGERNDVGIFNRKGAKPTKRLRGVRKIASRRDAPPGRARAVYDDKWYGALTAQQRKRLGARQTEFRLKVIQAFRVP